MVQWDGMDSWDGGIESGMTWDTSHSVHCVPWYSGTGWTVGIVVVRVGCFRTFPFCPLCPMVQWDGMDSWDGGTENGML